MWLFLIGVGSGFRKRQPWVNEINWKFVLFCFSTFSLQTSQPRPYRSEEWSGVVDAVLQRRGKEGVEVGSIHIRFELSPHLAGLRGKQLLLTLMLDIPKHKKYVFCRHKRHGSHYICQIPVYQVVSQYMLFCFIAVYLSWPNKAWAHQVVKAVPISQAELTCSMKILSQLTLKYDRLTKWLFFF